MQSFIRARKAAGPLLPLHAGDGGGNDGYSKTTGKRARWLASTPARVCLASAALAAVLALWWLSTPIVKAYRTARTPDHPSEATYLDDSGCVTQRQPMVAPAGATQTGAPGTIRE